METNIARWQSQAQAWIASLEPWSPEDLCTLALMGISGEVTQ